MSEWVSGWCVCWSSVGFWFSASSTTHPTSECQDDISQDLRRPGCFTCMSKTRLSIILRDAREDQTIKHTHVRASKGAALRLQRRVLLFVSSFVCFLFFCSFSFSYLASCFLTVNQPRSCCVAQVCLAHRQQRKTHTEISG